MFKIETWTENPILRRIADKVNNKDFKEAVKLGKEMIKYIRNPKNGWVWLAAPQIWHWIKLVVINMIDDREDESFKTIMMINPEILEYSKETDIETEWCLSVPWVTWEVERPTIIKVTFQDERNMKKTLFLEWLHARIIQHELDHINWKLFVDYLK
jgi:peptide deformylase